VRSGVAPIGREQAAGAVEDLTDDELRARLHFRMGLHAQRSGDDSLANIHFDRAIELAPLDFTIARAVLPRRGEDPFGENFFELYGRWQAAGSPYHGIDRGQDS
jgi:hypothetical protein